MCWRRGRRRTQSSFMAHRLPYSQIRATQQPPSCNNCTRRTMAVLSNSTMFAVFPWWPVLPTTSSLRSCFPLGPPQAAPNICKHHWPISRRTSGDQFSLCSNGRRRGATAVRLAGCEKAVVSLRYAQCLQQWPGRHATCRAHPTGQRIIYDYYLVLRGRVG